MHVPPTFEVSTPRWLADFHQSRASQLSKNIFQLNAAFRKCSSEIGIVLLSGIPEAILIWLFFSHRCSHEHEVDYTADLRRATYISSHLSKLLQVREHSTLMSQQNGSTFLYYRRFKASRSVHSPSSHIMKKLKDSLRHKARKELSSSELRDIKTFKYHSVHVYMETHG